MSEPRRPHRLSQCAKILRVLEDGRPHSAAEIHRISGFSRLNSRISELRKYGWTIECQRDSSKSGPEAYVYTLHRLSEGSLSPSGSTAGVDLPSVPARRPLAETVPPRSPAVLSPSTPEAAGQLLMFDPWSRRVA